MKSQWFVTMGVVVICFGLFFGIFIDMARAENEYIISITDIKYEITNINEEHEIIRYNIFVTLHNSGDITSDNMTIILEDEDGANITRKGVLPPGESITISYDDHPFFRLNDHTIQILYYPTNFRIPRNSSNTGDETFVLQYGENKANNDSPGFEIILMLLSIIIYLPYRKIKKKAK